MLASSAKAKVGKTHKAAKGKPVIRWRFNVFFLVVTVWRHAQAHAQLIVVVSTLRQPAHQRSAWAKCLEYKIETALASAQADKTCPMIATALLASDKRMGFENQWVSNRFTGRLFTVYKRPVNLIML